MKQVLILVIVLGLFSGSSAQTCRDLTYNNQPWHDGGGATFTCKDWYAVTARCLTDGGMFPFGGMIAKQACCVCGGGTRPQPLPPCVRDDTWVHSIFGDMCVNYDVGGTSRAYVCSDPEARRKCCLCVVIEPPPGVVCVNKQLAPGDFWHDSANYSCIDYERENCAYADNFTFGGLTARNACCGCGGGVLWQCTDKSLYDGNIWKDSRGYACSRYDKQQLCFSDADSYEMDSMTARQACCVCGGGVSTSAPRPDLGDDINMEWMLGVPFLNKKHLAGDMILYWNLDSDGGLLDNTDSSSEINVPPGHITVGILGPQGQTGWVSVGFSLQGTMEGADAVVGYVDFRPTFNNQSVIKDVHMKTNASSGIVSSTNQQLFTNSSVGWIAGRVGLVFTRPLFVPAGVSIYPLLDTATIVYSFGKISALCSTPAVPLMCAHNATGAAWTAKVFLNTPPGHTLSELNRGQIGQPCQGPSKLKCVEGLFCIHRNAADIYAPDFGSFGECSDSMSQVPASGKQTIFTADANGYYAGYQNRTVLSGGFELLWTIDRHSAEGDFWGLGDTISVALVSSGYDGWIAVGFSPNGIMKNTSVVFGYKDAAGHTTVQDCALSASGEMSQALKCADPGKQQLLSKSVIRQGNQTALIFQRLLYPDTDVPIVEGVNHVIIAAGPFPRPENPSFIPFHTYWATHDVAFLQNTSLVMLTGDFCGGFGGLGCEENATCKEINTSLFSSTYGLVYQEAGGAIIQSAYVSPPSIFSPYSEFMGRSVCVNATNLTISLEEISANQVLNPAEWQYNITLNWGFFLYYRYFNETAIELCLRSTLGPTWVGLGFGTQMLKSVAMVGWTNADGTTSINEYRLNSYFPWEIFPSLSPDDPNNQNNLFASDYMLYMNTSNMTVTYRGGETAIQFSMAVGPLIQPGIPQSIIYAGGSTPDVQDGSFSYHSYRDVKNITFTPYTTPPPTP